MRFTEDEFSTIKNALYVAAERFDENVKTLEAEFSHTGGKGRLAAQFERQSRESRALAERIERKVG